LFGADGLCDRRLNGWLADDGLGDIVGLGRKISIFVCARTPRSPGFSMLESGVVTCPPTGEVCACTPEAASNATINTENNKQRQQRVSQLPENPLILILRSACAARGQPLLLAFTQKPVPLWEGIKNIGVRQSRKIEVYFLLS
jgi:hypothetical protein